LVNSSITIGGTAIALGASSNALANDITVYGVTVGRGAGAVATNTAVGASAISNASAGLASTALGYFALTSATGNYNTGVGSQTLYNTTGSDNVGVGNNALITNTSGSYNVAVGRDALQANISASNNTAVGYQAGYTNQTGTQGVFIGYKAGYSNNATNSVYVGYTAAHLATGENNTVVGSRAVEASSSGTDNAIYGFGAGNGLGSGSFNTFIGRNAGSAITTGSKNVILGYYNGNTGGLDIRTASNYIVLSDGDGNPRGYFDGSGILNVPAKVLSPNLQGPTFSAYPSANQTITDSAWNKVTYDTEVYDTNSNFASSRFTPTVAGYYQVTARVVFDGFALGQSILTIRKNNVEEKRLMQIPNSVSSSVCPMGSALIYMNGSTDYIEIFVFQNSGSSQAILGSYSAETYFQAVMVRS
jgi:hypothetical protein